MRELPSASGLHRAVHCPGSTTLPRVDSETEAASRGQVLHKFLADCAAMGHTAALALVLEQTPEYHQACAALPLDLLPVDPSRFRPEVALAYDLETGEARELGQNLERRYDIRDTEVPGAIDVLGIENETALVADFKTGWAELPPARVNMQLRFLALAACRAYGLTRAKVAIIRTRDDRTPWFDEAEFGPEDLMAIEEQLLAARDQAAAERARVAAGAAPNVRTGLWCVHCPGRPHCPAYVQLVARMATQPGDVADEIRARLTPELAARAYAQLKMAKDALELVEGALRGWAGEHPIDLGDGLFYGPVATEKKSLDGDKTFAVVEKLHGRDIADLAVERAASQASIKRALEIVRHRSGVKVAPALRQVLEELEAAGGVVMRPGVSLREHKPKPAALPAAVDGAPAAATP